MIDASTRRFTWPPPARLSRRQLLGGIGLAGLTLAVADGVGAFAQTSVAPAATWEVPTSGAARPGPVAPITSVPTKTAGIAPAGIRIDAAGVDAPIERLDVVDGVMPNPTGPWVVSWYGNLAALGEGGNVVLAGHVDYWDVGPAVFANLRQLTPGTTIQIAGDDGEVFDYTVAWARNFDVAKELTPAVIQRDIVGDTGQESLTLITCGGPFNPDSGEHLARMVVRAERVERPQ